MLPLQFGFSYVTKRTEFLLSHGQEIPANLTKEDLAKDNKLFLTLASKALKWEEPAAPVRIAGPLYFVGTKGLSSFLFVTSEENILFNTGMPSSGPMIVESIKKLGFKPPVGQFPLKRLWKSYRKIPSKFVADKILGLADPEFEEGMFWRKDRVVSTKQP